MEMKKNAALLLWIFLVLAVILVLRAFETPPQAVELPSSFTKIAVLNESVNHNPAASINTPLDNAPASLRGTQVDGALRADKDGHLIIDNDIRRLFDYFLTTTGEEPLSMIQARLQEYIRLHLSEPAASQAEQLLKNYLALNVALTELQAPEGEPSNNTPDTVTLRERLSTIQELRHQYLPAEVIDAFYADDDALDQLALRRMEIMDDPALSTSQKTSALIEAEQSLPSNLQRITHDLNKHQQMNELTASLREHGGTDADVYQLRENFYGPEAADRLAQLDQSRQQWSARTSQWLKLRDSILTRQDLDEGDRKLELDRLRSEFFESAESRRVEALEQIHDKRLN